MGVLFKASELYNDMWKAIIRPPRDKYTIADLGPSKFKINNLYFKRRDFTLKNSRGLNLQCSHFEPIDSQGNFLTVQYPCVIYLHGNCSSRMEVINFGCLRALLPENISVFCFDFAGSGLSDGDYVSLGWHERKDLKTVVDHLRSLGRVSTIGLWGRSMGAVTACMYADIDPSIAAIVVDSPFTSLRKLAEELASDFIGWKVPRILVGAALNVVKNSVQTRANFDIDRLQPIQHCKRSFTPALFIAAKHDTFIRPHHCRELHDIYPGDKNFILVDGEHNSNRPSFLRDSISIFFQYALKITEANQSSKSKTVWDDVAISLAVAERLRRFKCEKVQASGKKKQFNEFFARGKPKKSLNYSRNRDQDSNFLTDQSTTTTTQQSSFDSSESFNQCESKNVCVPCSPSNRLLKSYLEPLRS